MDSRMEALLSRAERAIGEPGVFTSSRLHDAWSALRRIRFDPVLNDTTGRAGGGAVDPRPETARRCYDCKRKLPPADFHKGQKVCKPCNYARVKKWRAENPDKWHEQDRRRKQKKRQRNKEARERTREELNARTAAETGSHAPAPEQGDDALEAAGDDEA